MRGGGEQKDAMLTPAQRYFYDVNGYVVLEGVFSPAECRRFVELADRMDADDTCAYKHDGYPKTPALTVLSRCAWYDPHLLETALHPTLLPIMEDVVGGEVRLEEHQFLINYPNAECGMRPGARPGYPRAAWVCSGAPVECGMETGNKGGAAGVGTPHSAFRIP